MISFSRVACLSVSLIISAGASLACPCSTISVPENPGYTNVGGLLYSHTSGYSKELAEAIASAKRYCEEHMNVPNRAVVSDVDETLFDNRQFDAENQKFSRDKWDEWVAQERAPVIQQTADFLAWARQHGFAVFLVTTRREDQRLHTIANLVRDGIAYDGLYMRPTGDLSSHQTLKTSFRKDIQEMGFKIIVNVGDQFSDLAGGYAEDCEKLPNQMYFNK